MELDDTQVMEMATCGDDEVLQHEKEERENKDGLKAKV
jgi:hypothetical protein